MSVIQKSNKVIVYIDNDLDIEPTARKLVQSFSDNNIIHVTFQTLCDENFIRLNDDIISLVIMDWELWENNNDQIPSEMTALEMAKIQSEKEKQEQKNAEFIKLCLLHYIPTVVFSRHNVDDIQNSLVEHGVIEEATEDHPLLQISHKKDDISSIMDEWYEHFPSVKIFNMVRQSILSAEKTFFSNLIIVRNSWIKSMWDSFCAENELAADDKFESKPDEFRHVFKNFVNYIVTCIKNRVIVPEEVLDNGLVELIQSVESDVDDAKRIIETASYIPNGQISPTSVMPGDVYSDGHSYYVNIRAECDTARLNRGKTKVYILPSDIVPEEEFVSSKKYLGVYNELLSNDTYFVVPYICGGKIIKFKFKNLHVTNYSSTNQEIIIEEKKYRRVGRILPPYSIKLQQAYAHYFHRIGLNALPNIIVTGQKNT